jgi:hypothetical protein
MNPPHSTTPQLQKSTQGSGPKGAWHTFKLSNLDHLCYTCPLHDCVGTLSPRCPIVQARARMQNQAASAARSLPQEAAA